MSATKKIVTTDDIFIVTPDEKSYQHIYSFLRSADFRNAYDKDTQGLFNIGLEAVLWVLEQKLKDKKPDLIYLETSLFPERTRINDKIVDFLSLQINEDLSAEERTKLLREAFWEYKLIYTALHDTQNTVYYVPEFLQRPSAMRMVSTEYGKDTCYPESDVDRQKEISKLTKINASIKAIEADPEVQKDMRERDAKEFKGWTQKQPNVYVTRDFLRRQSPRNKREEVGEDLEINAYIFHKLFHERAFSKYGKTFLLCIPIVGAGENTSSRRKQRVIDDLGELHLVGQGALFVLLAYKRDDVSLTEPPENLATDIAKTVSYVLKDYFISYLYTSTREMVDEVINRSLRAAAGAIMSRNISHNIGSHVSPRTRMSAIEERLESFL